MRKLLKGQIWYFDLVVALTIFTLIIILSFKYISETFTYANSDILKEGEKFSDSLMSEGMPKNWNSSNIEAAGLLTNGSLDLSKVSSFNNITASDYDHIREISSLTYDFLVVFNDADIAGISEIGYPGYNYSDAASLDAEELIELTRYLTYRHDGVAEVVSMKIVMWDD